MSSSRTRKGIFALLFIAAASGLLYLTRRNPSTQWREASGAVWATTYHIVYRAPQALDDSILAAMRSIDLSVSPFCPESNISRINRNETDTLLPATMAVLRESMRINRLSQGLFDPTVAPLVDLWGFGRKGPTDTAPSDAAVDSALRTVGIHRATVDTLSRRLVKIPGMQFNFSAIAKGYGVDCVANMLERNGVTSYMVEIGGEMRLRGLNPAGQLWRVQIDSPASGASGHVAMRTLQLTDCAIASSGNYRQQRTLADGTPVSHTVSPVTGRPLLSTVTAVTVIAPRCITADALATAGMVMDTAAFHRIIKQEPNTGAIVAAGKAVVNYGSQH